MAAQLPSPKRCGETWGRPVDWLVSGSWVMVLCCIKLHRLPKCNKHGSQIAIATEIPRMPHPFCRVQEHPNKVCECVSTGRNS